MKVWIIKYETDIRLWNNKKPTIKTSIIEENLPYYHYQLLIKHSKKKFHKQTNYRNLPVLYTVGTQQWSQPSLPGSPVSQEWVTLIFVIFDAHICRLQMSYSYSTKDRFFNPSTVPSLSP